MNANSQGIKFSILVPVYNVEKYIGDCIESVLNQTHANFELVLVDDGSLDDSGHICDRYASHDSRITVIHKKNGGLISARREAIKFAKGDWCIFLDSDDYLDLKTLELLNQKIVETACDCVYYGLNNVDNGGTRIGCSQDIVREFSIENKRELYTLVFLNNGFNSLCRKAVRREMLSNSDYSPFYRIQRAEDLLQSLEIFKAAKKVLFLPLHLYNYRANPTSITHSIKHEKYCVDFTVREKVLQFLLDENVWEDQDFAKYWRYCASLFVSEIIMVASFDTNYKIIKSFFDEMSKTNYYSSFISNDKYIKSKKELSPKEKLIYFLFKTKQYRLLFLIVKSRRKMSDMTKTAVK